MVWPGIRSSLSNSEISAPSSTLHCSYLRSCYQVLSLHHEEVELGYVSGAGVQNQEPVEEGTNVRTGKDT